MYISFVEIRLDLKRERYYVSLPVFSVELGISAHRLSEGSPKNAG